MLRRKQARPQGGKGQAVTSPVTTENNAVDEAIRTLNLKLDVRKQDIWSPGVSFSAEIGEVETLIHEVYQLRSALTASEKDAARYRWLREHRYTDFPGKGNPRFMIGADMDAAIDAAMEKANG